MLYEGLLYGTQKNVQDKVDEDTATTHRQRLTLRAHTHESQICIAT